MLNKIINIKIKFIHYVHYYSNIIINKIRILFQ